MKLRPTVVIVVNQWFIQIAFPTINLDNLDPQLEGLNVVGKATDAKLNTVLSNSFGFGGTNAAVVLKERNG